MGASRSHQDWKAQEEEARSGFQCQTSCCLPYDTVQAENAEAGANQGLLAFGGRLVLGSIIMEPALPNSSRS